MINNHTNFIKKSNKIHNNRYDYSLVDYIKSSIKVKIICLTHGIFEYCKNNNLKLLRIKYDNNIQEKLNIQYDR